ncbi:4-hydroxythreonine-4-phosphate dehydrogenase PdxA [Polynucleobacter meluiroseus]|nr:4-hydroxythreonine-4-phosphate dehydrogenase PdxA [Polynucleobacter meluiroseus]
MIQHPAPVNLVISSGEPAGIGPEVSVAAALSFLGEQPDAHVTLVGDPQVLQLPHIADAIAHRLTIDAVKLAAPSISGQLNPVNARYVLDMLDIAIDGCLEGRFDAMVTAPLQKSVINDAKLGADAIFTGHTEYLAKRCGVKHVVMMLCADLPQGFLGLNKAATLRVALVTIHLPLRAVASAITQELILETIQIVNQDLRHYFAIENPAIRIAGLNPHAGEGGYLGSEEIEIIAPAIEMARGMGIDVKGPYPGDTMFDAHSLGHVDAFIAMYHDQGLAPFKFVSFGDGVNVTLGLPIIRTSVDHGTALDIAGKGSADPGSMLEALRLAYQMAVNRKGLQP